jgi:hypothetical protein
MMAMMEADGVRKAGSAGWSDLEMVELGKWWGGGSSFL